MWWFQGRPAKWALGRKAIGFTLVLGAPQDGKCEKNEKSMNYVDTHTYIYVDTHVCV